MAAAVSTVSAGWGRTVAAGRGRAVAAKGPPPSAAAAALVLEALDDAEEKGGLVADVGQVRLAERVHDLHGCVLGQLAQLHEAPGVELVALQEAGVEETLNLGLDPVRQPRVRRVSHTRWHHSLTRHTLSKVSAPVYLRNKTSLQKTFEKRTGKEGGIPSFKMLPLVTSGANPSTGRG